jgi:hypothetical protein
LAPLGDTSPEPGRTSRHRARPPQDYRAVLAVSSVNYALKSEGEQEAITASYQAFLNGLAFPIQVLVRVVPLDLSPYLARLEAIGQPDRDVGDAVRQSVWSRLAHDHAQFVRDLSLRHVLLERHFYVIVPADGEIAGSAQSRRRSASANRSPLARFFQTPRSRTRRAAAEQLAAARQQLDLRAGEIIRQLGRIGLEARRLGGPELAALYHSCLTPARAARHPLPAQAIAGVGHPVCAPPALSNACVPENISEVPR